MRTYECGAHDGARTSRFTVEVDERGMVVGVRHPAHPGLNAVLDRDIAPWFGDEWAWGTGMLVTSAGSARFGAGTPCEVAFEADRVECRDEPVEGLELRSTRAFGETWRETYALHNQRAEPVTIGSFGINTPIADTYGPASTVLRERLHAHVWTGGAESWLVGVRMDGVPPALALDLTEGELWAYSIAGRNAFTSSNIRGVLTLHPTDRARAPHAFGGQPEIVLEPGQKLLLAWRIGWYDDIEAALSGHRSTIRATLLAAPIGEPITLATPRGPVTSRETAHGVAHLDVTHEDGRRSRVAVLHHTPIDALVRTRVDALLDRHRAAGRRGSRSGAFVPYDVEHGLPLLHDLGWTDWNDARERVGMPLLLLASRARGWVSDHARVDGALHAYRDFCADWVLTPEGRVRDGSTAPSTRRLYNRPWFALLYSEFFRAYGRTEDLDTAIAILDRYYEDGGAGFLAITVAEAVHAVAGQCAEAGRAADAERLRESLVRQGVSLAALGTELPAHEVAYEQSMTAPLLSILCGAWRIASAAGDSRASTLLAAARVVLPWMLAFAGRQPHVRLRNVPIRHWDGYWFGRLRLWGDTFPHYWSVLSPRALLDLPDELRAETADPMRLGEIVRDVTAANLVDFTPDGHASCAFVFPSCVDDSPAHVADPLANDQDMGLALTLLPTSSGRTLL